MRYVFYDANGNLHRDVKYVDTMHLEINTPAGFTALAHATAKPEHHVVDSATGVVHPAPQPTPEHEWNVKEERWELNEAAKARLAVKAAARAEIIEIERSQARVVREVLLERPGALERLREVDRQIAELRSKL